MNARSQLERLYHGGPAAPVEAPPKPDVRPASPPRERPGAPPGKPGLPDPWEPPDIKPGYEPRPKSRYAQHVHAEAQEFLRLNGLEEFVR